MSRGFYSSLVIATLAASLPGESKACTSTSAPGRLTCNAAELIAPAARRADDIPYGAASRASTGAAEQARVRASMEHLETTRRQRTDMVKAAQDASARTQASAPKRVERETQKQVLRESQQAVQTSRRLAPTPPAQGVVRPEVSATRLQQLKAANTPKLATDAKNSIGAAIHGTELSTAATAARQQRKLDAKVRQQIAPANQKAPRLSDAKLVDNAALAKQQAMQKRPKPAAGTAAIARARAGTATYDGKLAHVKDPKWLAGRHSSPLPGQVAQRLAGRKFNSFDHLRENVWREIGNDPVLSRSFGPGNVKRMQAGDAPYALTSQHRGQRMRYELDHTDELRDGGPVYDLNNLRIKTPDAHVRKITRDFNLAAGAR